MEPEEIVSHKYTAEQMNAELAQLGDDFWNQVFRDTFK